MTPSELYHRLQSDITFHVKAESRDLFLSVLSAGFDETGKAMPLSDYQKRQLNCLACADYDTDKCTVCGQFLVATG